MSFFQPDFFITLDFFCVLKNAYSYDCGICTLMNAQLWLGRSIPDYTGKDLPNMRKLLTNGWVTTELNKIDWKATLNL